MPDLSRRRFVLSGASLSMVSLGATVLSGCAVARGAPSRREVIRGSDSDGVAEDFSVYEVNRNNLGDFTRWHFADAAEANMNWPAPGNGRSAPSIAVGDRLDLRIWDAEASSLITPDAAKATDMAGLVVSPGGSVFLPYVGNVQIVGLTPDSARRRIQDRMEAIIPSAQVQLTYASGPGNSVDLVSGVSNPGSYPLLESSMSLLNMISQGGGVPSGLSNPRVRLIRGARVYVTSLAGIYADPKRDIALRGRDRVIVEADERFFIALGASGTETTIPFPSDTLDALRGVSLMGGMDDGRADPRGLLILRRYPASRVGAPGQPRTERVVFSFDLTSADGLFSAGEFPIVAGDVLLATQATATTTERVLRLFGGVLGAGRAVSSATN